MLRLRNFESDEINGKLTFTVMEEVEGPYTYQVIMQRSWGMMRIKLQKLEFGNLIETEGDLEVS